MSDLRHRLPRRPFPPTLASRWFLCARLRAERVVAEEFDHFGPDFGCGFGSSQFPQRVRAAVDTEFSGYVGLEQAEVNPAASDVVADVLKGCGIAGCLQKVRCPFGYWSFEAQVAIWQRMHWCASRRRCCGCGAFARRAASSISCVPRRGTTVFDNTRSTSESASLEADIASTGDLSIGRNSCRHFPASRFILTRRRPRTICLRRIRTMGHSSASEAERSTLTIFLH